MAFMSLLSADIYVAFAGALILMIMAERQKET
jgi:hypothetical protein